MDTVEKLTIYVDNKNDLDQFENIVVKDKFNNKIDFEVSLIPYKTNTGWINEKIVEMKKVLNYEKIPDINIDCEKCAYLKGGSNFFK